MLERLRASAWGLLPALLLSCGGDGQQAPTVVDASVTAAPLDVLVAGPQWLPSGGRSTLRLVTWRDGRPAPGERARLTIGKHRVFDGQTGADGTAAARFVVPESVQGKARVHLEVGPPGAAFEVTRDLEVRDRARPLLQVDRRRVHRGERVRLRLVAIHPDKMGGTPGLEAKLRIFAADGTLVERLSGATSDARPIAASTSWIVAS